LEKWRLVVAHAGQGGRKLSAGIYLLHHSMNIRAVFDQDVPTGLYNWPNAFRHQGSWDRTMRLCPIDHYLGNDVVVIFDIGIWLNI
jgi:hypothetical protein